MDGFVDAFEYLTRRIDTHAVVALDEFSYLVESDGDTILSSDDTYESIASRPDLKTVDDN